MQDPKKAHEHDDEPLPPEPAAPLPREPAAAKPPTKMGTRLLRPED